MEKYLFNKETGIISKEGTSVNDILIDAELLENENNFQLVGFYEGSQIVATLTIEEYFQGKEFKADSNGLINGQEVYCIGITSEPTKCKVIDRYYSGDSIEVEILESTWKGNVTIVSKSNVTPIVSIDPIQKAIEDNTQALKELLIDSGFEFTLDGFGECNYIHVETFSYLISICIDESSYSLCTKNLDRKEYGIYEDEHKNHREIKKAKTVLKYINKYDK